MLKSCFETKGFSTKRMRNIFDHICLQQKRALSRIFSNNMFFIDGDSLRIRSVSMNFQVVELPLSTLQKPTGASDRTKALKSRLNILKNAGSTYSKLIKIV